MAKMKISDSYDMDLLKLEVKKKVFKIGSIPFCSREIGIADGTLRNFIYGDLKQPQMMILLKLKAWVMAKQ
jgi:hypothetical protein